MKTAFALIAFLVPLLAQAKIDLKDESSDKVHQESTAEFAKVFKSIDADIVSWVGPEVLAKISFAFQKDGQVNVKLDAGDHKPVSCQGTFVPYTVAFKDGGGSLKFVMTLPGCQISNDSGKIGKIVLLTTEPDMHLAAEWYSSDEKDLGRSDIRQTRMNGQKVQ